MPYPKDQPTKKHDVVGPWPLPPSAEGGVLSPSYGSNLSSTESIFSLLDGSSLPSHKPKLISTAYTYPDGPTDPGPLSRALMIVGFADASLSLVRKLASPDDPSSCLRRCTVAVKLADAKHRSHLDGQNKAKSDAFARLMTTLRDEGAAAILGVDKVGRFAILRPMEREGDDGGESGRFVAEDYAADCYVGRVEEAKEALARGGGTEVAAAVPEDAGVYDAAPPLAGTAPVENGAAEAAADDGGGDLWQPPGGGDDGDEPSPFGVFGGGGGTDDGGFGGGGGWDAPTPGFGSASDEVGFGEGGTTAAAGGQKRSASEMDADGDDAKFHADEGAAAADRFYSNLTRSLDTRADSRLFHMRAFNGWVKATQIAELDPRCKRKGTKRGAGRGPPLRILDLACGKGGDLGKWTLHPRGIENYVGSDVARGSLVDAALRARKMRGKLRRCAFTCADLGSDVPGRPRSAKRRRMQKLLTWSLRDEDEHEMGDPNFERLEGGGISTDDRFDVVSIQFAIHYMMSTRKRARRFFKTVSELLDVGGNLIATTIDARVVLSHMMNLGLDVRFRNGQGDGDGGGDDDDEKDFATVKVGGGVCRLKFDEHIVRRIFAPRTVKGRDPSEDLFGLQYTFTLVEGSDHSAGVGEAVDLPEWLTPLPALESLASEAGLELEYARNFHEFYKERRDPNEHPMAHNALYSMKVLDRRGSVSKDEWEVSRMYVAVKFRKVREPNMVLEEDDEEEEEAEEAENEEEEAAEVPPPVAVVPPPAKEPSHDAMSSVKAKKLFPMAMMKAKSNAGAETWQTLTNEEKTRWAKVELAKML